MPGRREHASIRRSGLVAFLCAICTALPVVRLNAAEAPAAGKPAEVSFERHIRPILKSACFSCHGEDTKKSQFDTRQVRLLIRGGKKGPAIVPGDAAGSRLYQRVAKGEMPPGKREKLTEEQVALIGQWINAGAPTDRPEAELDEQAETFVTKDDQRAWAYQTPRKPPVPAFSSTDRVHTPIDAFVVARLREKGLGFSPDAEKPALIRRLYIDLLGLPPSPREIDAFIADASPDAYERLVDRLLDSPHYGERWARHWLDVAGYADSDGYTDADTPRPWAFRYRDYVIDAFNADIPYDRFLIEQLAGDELIGWPDAELTPENRRLLIATGFLRNAADGTGAGNVDKTLAAHQVIADTITITMTSLLGLSVQCAQCHNHRYDPISQKDYFRVRAVFEPAYNTEQWRAPSSRLISLLTPADREKIARIEKEAQKVTAERNALTSKYLDEIFAEQIVKVPEDTRARYTEAYKTPAGKRTKAQNELLNKYPAANVTPGVIYQYRPNYRKEIAEFDKRIAEIRKDRPAEKYLRPLTEVPGQAPVSRLFRRGDYRSPGGKIAPGVLSVLTSLESPHPIEPNLADVKTTGRRLQFARWLTRPDHPLTARVFVNRVWMHHFGAGIVTTPSDFGTMGEPPTHPELLDWLATEFVENGWRIKALHRMMVTSTAYRQASGGRQEAAAVDPDNRLLWRQRVRRLEGETMRDAMLVAGGVLNPMRGGPAVPVREDERGRIIVGRENKQGANQPGALVDMKGQEYRRSIYIEVRRSKPLSMLKTFDVPDMETNCGRREQSVSAMQALTFMNGDFIRDQARYLAERVKRESPDDLDARIALAYRLVFGRRPADDERAEAKAYLAAQTEYIASRDKARDDQALLQYAQALVEHARQIAGRSQEALQQAERKLTSQEDKAQQKTQAKGPEPPKKPTPPDRPPAEIRAWTNFCQVLFSASAFLYVD